MYSLPVMPTCSQCTSNQFHQFHFQHHFQWRANQKASELSCANQDQSKKASLRSAPEFSTVNNHKRVTWDFHCLALSEVIVYLLEIHFWLSHTQIENHGFKTDIQQIKFMFPERQRRLSFHAS